MFTCECGGIYIVVDVEEYSEDMSGFEKLEYERKCTVECSECGDIKKGQKYD